MPQMSPMSWMILFFMFTMLFLFFNILKYFNFIPTFNPTKNNITFSLSNSPMTWKW
uniref:ATP synthase complex subunit 8 n=1 Tax=Demicryptochironomus spatulatus TaxID=3231394 RepID=A0AB39A6P6_9DIPT